VGTLVRKSDDRAATLGVDVARIRNDQLVSRWQRHRLAFADTQFMGEADEDSLRRATPLSRESEADRYSRYKTVGCRQCTDDSGPQKPAARRGGFLRAVVSFVVIHRAESS
jgi:hypothetical protein